MSAFGLFIRRVYSFATEPQAKKFVVAYAEQFGNGGPAEALTMAAPTLCLSTDAAGTAPSIYACSFALQDAVWQQLLAVEAELPNGLSYVMCDNFTDPAAAMVENTVRASNFAWGVSQIGELYAPAACLAALGFALPTPPANA